MSDRQPPTMSNPYNPQHEAEKYRAYTAGYQHAVKVWREENEEWRSRVQTAMSEQFVNELYALAQQYGGERFQFDGDDQDTLEAVTAKLQTAVKELSGRVDSIRTLR